MPTAPAVHNRYRQVITSCIEAILVKIDVHAYMKLTPKRAKYAKSELDDTLN